MLDPVEHMYCAEQINIPVNFPYILKLYAKAAVRTQPYDLLRWTSAYFRALADENIPPVKNLFETMVYVCELLTEEPEGGSAMIPLKTFLSLYGYLANLNCTGEPEASDVCFCESASEIAEKEEEEGDEEFKAIEKEQVEEAEVKTRTSRETVSDLALGYADQIGEETESYHQVAADQTIQEVDKDEVIPQVSGEEDDLELLRKPVQNQTVDADIPEVEREPEDEGTLEEKKVLEDEKKNSQIVAIIDRVDQSPEIKPINGDQEPLPVTETPRISHEIVDELKNVDEKENEVEEAKKKREHVYSYSFKEVETESSSFEDEYNEHEPIIGLEKLLEGTFECRESKGETEQPPEMKPPVDLLEEFVSRMKVQFPNPCELFKVPGIGPKVSEDKVTAVGLWLAECSRRQNGVVGPRNMRHFLCPSLDDHPAYEDRQRTKLKCP
ncbi:uncharacterized protein LOC117175194 isoform X2 [Belonocnema kinseyi]|uniref:uncharacterized protein LOC117175194 isoform X2 n=1 Tax=Belonocnema kinseyi TaxID=2817044 RepID=UPI00143DEF49|nr:uncharacterized protein LOC117175194 isoform X2 [Belonocnema kinseyi]